MTDAADVKASDSGGVRFIVPPSFQPKPSVLVRRKARSDLSLHAAPSVETPETESAAVSTEAGSPAGSQEAERTPESAVPETVGISLSGGGVRSASFSLGAFQALGRHGYLRGPRCAKYLSAVSGGSYIAGAAALLARYMEDDRRADGVPAPTPNWTGPFEQGSPEESYLRNHLSYLTRGPGGIPAFAWRMLLGVLLNLALVGLVLQFVGRPLGWAYGHFYPALRAPASNVTIAIAPWVVWTAVGLGCGAVLIGWVAVGVRKLTDRHRRIIFAISGLTLISAAAFSLLLVGFPELLVFTRGTVARIGGPTHAAVGGPQSVSTSTRRVGGAAAASGAGIVLTILASLRNRLTDPAQVKAETTGLGKWLRAWLLRHKSTFLNAAAALLVPLALLATFVVFMEVGAAHTVWAHPGGGLTEFWYWFVPAAVLGVFWRFSDLNAWSMHSFYKRALCRAFALRRIKGPSGDPSSIIAEELPYDHLYCFSESQPADFPELLVCAAVNLSDYGVTPTGSKVAPYVFSAKASGSDIVGVIDTGDYERAVGSNGDRDLTLPAAVSISGAAVAPEMGRMTRAPLRALLTLANVRLGVWVPNPAHIREFMARKNRKLFPYSPRLPYLVREMFGYDHRSSRFLYVTDGGHDENLGLVELFRRRCTKIYCVDASGEKIFSFGTIFQAIRLAESELGVEFHDFDPTTMAPAVGSQLVRSTFAAGTFTYGDGQGGALVVIKAGVPAGAPPELLDYQAGHPLFPCDPTTDQFFDANLFDAYRALGSFAMEQALQAFP